MAARFHDSSMSDAKLVDLTLNTLIERLGELAEAIAAMRYASLSTDLRDIEERLSARVSESESRLKRAITDLNGELLAQTNQIITLQHDVRRLLLKDETTP